MNLNDYFMVMKSGSTTADVYIDPTMSDIHRIVRESRQLLDRTAYLDPLGLQFRGFLLGPHAYLWDGYHATHWDFRDTSFFRKERPGLPFVAFYLDYYIKQNRMDFHITDFSSFNYDKPGAVTKERTYIDKHLFIKFLRSNFEVTGL